MKTPTSGSIKVFWLVLLRILIGWHFLYEGLVKLINPDWSAAGFLLDSGGFMAPLFKGMAANFSVLSVVDFLNIWGLILIGLSLMLGLFTRLGLLGGIALLAMYYLSHPPFLGIRYAMPSEGSYLVVNKNLIEMAAMAVLWVCPGHLGIGIDRFIFKHK